MRDRHFSDHPLDPIPQAVPREPKQVGMIVFGSEQGLGGSFNEQMADYLADQLDQH